MYQFKKINDDEYILISGEKEYPFKRTVDIAKEMQSIDMVATIIVAELLAERGETYENTKLRVERKEGNKIIVDESNLRALEKKAKQKALEEVISRVYKKLFNKNIIELLVDIGIDLEDEELIQKFSTELTEILVKGIDDNTPRSEGEKGN